MSESLRNFLTPPIFQGDIEKTRHARLLYYSTVIIFVFSTVLYALNSTIGTEAEQEQTWILGLLPLVQLPALFLIRAGYVNQVSFFQLALIWGIMTTFGRTVAGIHDVSIMVYIIIMMSSAILLSWRATIFFMLLSIGVVWWLAFLQETNTLTPIIGEPYRVALDLTVIFLLAFVIIYFFVRALTNALQDAKLAMTERFHAEAQLEKAIVKLSDEIAERKMAQAELQEQAITDFLTGLFNRRYFFEIARKEFAKALRYARPLSIIIFDLDHFKDVNDTYGHSTGDQVLMQIGDLLRKLIRDVDISARYGGEEFIILLPEMDCENAQIAAERLRRRVQDAPIQMGGLLVHITISAGVAGKGSIHNTTSLDHLISKADLALYQAKRAGRNQVVCYKE